MKKIISGNRLSFVILFLALCLLVLSMTGEKGRFNLEKVTEQTTQRLQKRLSILERHAVYALENASADIEAIPEDMVIYRYQNDSLQSWSNQFSIINDDISRRMVFQRLSSFNSSISSPLAEITDEITYSNLGPKWYAIRAYNGADGTKVIAGLEIKNSLIDDLKKSENGVNPHLRLSGNYSVAPMATSGGCPVIINDTALFKVIHGSTEIVSIFSSSTIRWIALFFCVLAAIIFLYRNRSFKVYAGVIAILGTLTVLAYFWELQISDSAALFSPTLYADGAVFFSLGSLLLINTFITIFHICTYMMREKIASSIRTKKKTRKLNLIIYGTICFILAAALLIYTHLTFESLILNSNISMELYRGQSEIGYMVVVYISYTGLFFCLMLLIQSMQPVIREIAGLRYNVFKPSKLALFSLLCASYFTLTSGVTGLRKEQDRVMVWANRLAIERDLGLEIQLRTVEEQIASDQLISSLAAMQNTQSIILNRISEYYLARTRQGYTMNLRLFSDNDKQGLAYFSNVLRLGTPIAENSSFLFITDNNGRSRYTGAFAFYSKEKGITRMLIDIEPNSNREDRGYYSILGQFSNPGEINIPDLYSYAKYKSDKLISYKGNYPYPTVHNHGEHSNLFNEKKELIRKNGHVHFQHLVGEDEVIVISRPQRGAMVYFTSLSYLFLVLFGFLYVFTRNGSKNTFRSNYFRTRINIILFASSLMVLTSMTIISVLFVYKRNEVNMYNLMSSKINTIQAFIENRARTARSWHELTGQEFSAVLENIGNTTKSDITLYTPAGKVFKTTTPEVFEKMILGSRINQDAFHNIRHLNQRYYIHREKLEDFSYWSMYAPVFNDQGDLLAIISSPYTDRNYDFRREAFFHAALIINLFILLLIASLLFSTREVNSMFMPLIEMGKKMNVADVHNLEYIIYKRDDEISSLVDAYNRMVRDLSDSTKQLAQAERDKAWSQMARQVAHEIKNPLTPIKLQIQRLIRMKQKQNPAWEERFDEVSAVVLEHIDILTETANEFSTFAKLYSEEHVLLDLDKTLKDQLVIFDNKENIHISYIGMEKALVMAPKPQLIRVFVNLITNAIQAVELHQHETSGTEPGRVLICLRNSIKDGYYDVVFDDNGPGVSEENMDKLFTPNFTTKSSGTGLGLAICRNIIEKCDGEIRYQKSFSLNGASFIVTLPKYQG